MIAKIGNNILGILLILIPVLIVWLVNIFIPSLTLIAGIIAGVVIIGYIIWWIRKYNK